MGIKKYRRVVLGLPWAKPNPLVVDSNAVLVGIVGPSGVGKTTAANGLVGKGFTRIVTYTTRAPRVGEVDGIDYNFVSVARIKALFVQNKLLELSEFGGNYYGTPRTVLDKNYVIVVDSRGAKLLRQVYHGNFAVIQLTAPVETLKRRLAKDSEESVMRLDRDEKQIKFPSAWGFTVNTDDKTPCEVVECILRGLGVSDC